MKLLIYSHFFAPSVGGVESMVMSLATGLRQMSQANPAQTFEIMLVTQTPQQNFDDTRLPFGVVRQPGLFKLRRLIKSADVVHVAGAAIAPIVLGLLSGKRVVVEHHGFQAICPNGQLLIEPSAAPCHGHFMDGRNGEGVL